MNAVPTVLDERARAAAAASGDLDVAYDVLDDTPVGPLLVGVSEHGRAAASTRSLRGARTARARVRPARPAHPERTRPRPPGARRVLRRSPARLRPRSRSQRHVGVPPARSCRAEPRRVRAHDDVRRAGEAGRRSSRGASCRDGDEPEPDADRPSLPPRGWGERQPHRLRWRARPQRVATISEWARSRPTGRTSDTPWGARRPASIVPGCAGSAPTKTEFCGLPLRSTALR